MLDMPSMILFCYDEIVRWLDMGFVSFFKGEDL